MTRAVETSCLFCRRTEPPENFIYEDAHWLVRHSNETNILGYAVIEAKRHFIDLSAATDTEAASYGVILRAVTRAIREVTGCQRVYTFSLGEMVEHFHLHVVPRTESMPRTFRGRGILAYPTKPPGDASLTAEVSKRLTRRIERLLPVPANR